MTRAEKNKLWSQMKMYFDEKKYRFFTKGSFNVNIIGVRKSGKVDNLYDDDLYLMYYDTHNEIVIKQYPITTQPGLYYMQSRLGHKDGTFILAPGQYRSAYTVGLHRGQYTALVQRKAVTGYRDNNKDDVYDMKPEKRVEGYFGINIHRSNPYAPSPRIDRWSAGCQVFADPDDYYEFITIILNARSLHGDAFTYTLIERDEFELFTKTHRTVHSNSGTGVDHNRNFFLRLQRLFNNAKQLFGSDRKTAETERQFDQRLRTNIETTRQSNIRTSEEKDFQ